MKSDVVSALENASWPALVVEGSGIVCHANAAARKLFGDPAQGGPRQLSSIWSAENGLSAIQFLTQWVKSPVQLLPLKFRSMEDATASWLASVCPMAEEKKEYFVLQLFPQTVLLPEPKAPAGEASQAHKQKLDCALQLARTVALDFNNALTSILGHTSLVLAKMEPNHPWRRLLLEVEKSAARAAEIANDLGTFSRQEKEVRAQASGNLNILLQRIVEFFQQNAGSEQVSWALQLERKLFTARFDEAKMQQAFIKIIENAIQSLRGAGRITIQTRNLELAQPTQDRNVQLAAGAYVCVEITDTGCGIEADVLPRIFEPFFTTKRGGNHRGLGLAWVYGIVTNHGGGVAVSSQPGTGTSVRVYLPSETRIVRSNGVTGQDLNGTQTILIVDDEDLLLTMGQTILSSYGYTVLTANSGQKALEVLKTTDSPVELVITDLVMPAMSGRELVEHIRRVSPGTRILCTSGYVWPAGQETDEAYLQKPFTSTELLLKVKQVMAPEQST